MGCIKQTDILVIGVPRRKDREKARNLLDEIMAENFPTGGKEMDIQTQKAQCSEEISPKRPTSRHVIIKSTKS